MSTSWCRHDCLILDACCTINLYASGQMDNILKALSVQCTIASYVHKKEALKIYDRTKDKTTQGKVYIDLQPLINSGLLIVASLEGEDESRDVINFVYSGLDDGEAITGAIARHRNWGIGTDDKAAISFFEREMPHVQVFTTPELVQLWVETTHPAFEVVASSLNDIQLRAKYTPSPKHPLHHWWMSYTYGYIPY